MKMKINILVSILILIFLTTAEEDIESPHHDYNDLEEYGDYDDWDELYEDGTWVSCINCQDFTDFQADTTIVDLFLDIDFTGESDFSALSGCLDLLVDLEYVSIWIYGVEDSVTDLTGLERILDNNDLLIYFDLWIEGSMISDISILDGLFTNNAMLEIVYVDFYESSVDTAADLVGAFPATLTSLNIFLGYTMISDLSPFPMIFADFPDLMDASLDLSGLSLTDFTGLDDLFDTNTELYYVYLGFAENNITSLDGINNIFGTLEMTDGWLGLDFWMNQISDISGVKDLIMAQTSLMSFDIWLYENQVDDVSVFTDAFENSVNLEWIIIELMENPVSDLSPFMNAFQNCDKLEILYIGLSEECYIDEGYLNDNYIIESITSDCQDNYTYAGGFTDGSEYLSFALISFVFVVIALF